MIPRIGERKAISMTEEVVDMINSKRDVEKRIAKLGTYQYWEKIQDILAMLMND